MSPGALQHKRQGEEKDSVKKPKNEQVVREEDNQESVALLGNKEGKVFPGRGSDQLCRWP